MKNLAREVLAITWLRRVYVFVNRFLLEVLGTSRALIHLYYLVAILTFNREQAAVWRGRRDYYRFKVRPQVSHVGLRRNVHRLEKALIMRPRRSIFAADYIVETIEFYQAATKIAQDEGRRFDSEELAWAADVLREYFSVVSPGNAKIDVARARFATFAAGDAALEPPFRVPRPKQQLSSITYDEMLALAEQRRSVRWFSDAPVSHELLDKALMVARQAPTACNRLPYEFRVFDEPEAVRKVISLPFGAAGFGHNVKTVVVVVGKLSSYFSPRDRHAIYIDSSLAAMSFIFALETLGLSSTVINWPDLEPLERTMQKTLGLNFSDRVVMLIAVGYADPTALVPFSQKKELDSIRSFNKMS